VTIQVEQPTDVDDLEQRVLEWIRRRKITTTPDGRIKAAAAAELIGVRPRTLKDWEDEGLGPRSVKLGKSRFYRVDSLIKWLREAEKTEKAEISEDAEK
jgi:phage terminase Nu1 subunit (DNA packaging protein)